MIKKGSHVSISYEGRFSSGEVFDSSKHGDHDHPLEFEVGAEQVIPGLEKEIIGMKEGDEKEITIEPKEAYGENKSTLHFKIPRKALPQDKTPVEGMSLIIPSPDGREIPVKIIKVTDEEVTIDLNHPLAGRTLIFKIKILKVG